VAVLAFSSPAPAATPKPGTYRATTSQCGSATLAHPCYAFSVKIAKGHCVAPGGSRKQAGYCVTFGRMANGGMTFADVTCPDSKTFQAFLIGPSIPYRLSSSGTLKFAEHSGVTEAGKEYVVGSETLTLSVKGSRLTGTLTDLTQESIGLEAPHCATGKVTFTARKA
jgi:hypothetical protein